MSEKQLTFDVARDTRRYWLRHMIIPPFERQFEGRLRATSGDNLNQFMLAVEFKTYSDPDRPVQLSKIAEAMKLRTSKKAPSVSSVRRAMRDCVACGILKVIRSSGRGNCFEIDLCRVKEILLENEETASIILVPTKTPNAEGTPTNAEGTPTNAEGTPTNAEGTPTNADDRPLPSWEVCPTNLVGQTSQVGTPDLPSWEGRPTTLVGVAVADTSSSRACDHEFNSQSSIQVSNQSFLKNDVLKTAAGKMLEDGFGKTDLGMKGTGKGGWPYRISIFHLKVADEVQTLWQYASVKWSIQPEMRVKFFTLARFIVRIERQRRDDLKKGSHRKRSEIKDVGRLFTHYVRKREWRGTLADEDWAISEIKRIDGRKREIPYDARVIPS